MNAGVKGSADEFFGIVAEHSGASRIEKCRTALCVHAADALIDRGKNQAGAFFHCGQIFGLLLRLFEQRTGLEIGGQDLRVGGGGGD